MSDEAPSKDEINAAMFAHMVMQQSNMAMLLLGKVPHPETGKTMRDLDAAQLFIDQLEMLEVKTKGNLSKEEASLLKQSLMGLRMAFVEAINAQPSDHTQASDSPAPPAASGPENVVAESPPPSSEESHKKFSKKY